MSKYILNIIKQILPEILQRHFDKDKVDEVMADVEKTRINAFSGLLERGGILHLFYVYSLLVINQYILVPYITAFTGKEIYITPLPEELSYLVLGLGSVILGKKHLDKRK